MSSSISNARFSNVSNAGFPAKHSRPILKCSTHNSACLSHDLVEIFLLVRFEQPELIRMEMTDWLRNSNGIFKLHLNIKAVNIVFAWNISDRFPLPAYDPSLFG